MISTCTRCRKAQNLATCLRSGPRRGRHDSVARDGDGLVSKDCLARHKTKEPAQQIMTGAGDDCCKVDEFFSGGIRRLRMMTPINFTCSVDRHVTGACPPTGIRSQGRTTSLNGSATLRVDGSKIRQKNLKKGSPFSAPIVASSVGYQFVRR